MSGQGPDVRRDTDSLRAWVIKPSRQALVRIGREIRRWALHHRSDKSLEELARMYNPTIRG
jgi:hypothetical protein